MDSTTSGDGSGSTTQRAIVHIGLPKAGSTTFQTLLWQQRDRLLEHDIRVLTYDGPDDQQACGARAFDLANCVVRADLDVWWHAYLPESALPEFVERGRRSIREQVDQPEDLLVASVEDLALIRTAAEVERLEELLAPREVHIVLVLRDAETWLRSLRGQLVAGGYRTTSNWPRSTRNLASDSWLVDFAALIRVLEDGIGAARLTILDYDQVTRDEGSLLPTLWSACELPPDLLVPSTEGGSGAWANRSKAWSRAAEPPPGTTDELEWLRDRVVSQARELARLKRRKHRIRTLVGRIRRALNL